MGYRNKTYVIFDGDEDIAKYRLMLGWKANKNIDFSFYDAHDLNTITLRANEETAKKRLRERLSNAKQAIVLVGEKTKNLYKFVRWEIEVCQELDIPIIVVNLNGKRDIDFDLCPPILRDTCAVHVSFRAKIIKSALEKFVLNYDDYKKNGRKNLHFIKDHYDELGLKDEC